MKQETYEILSRQQLNQAVGDLDMRALKAGLLIAAVTSVLVLPAVAAKLEFLMDVPDTTEKDMYIEVGGKSTGEGMWQREGKIYVGKKSKPLFYVVATCGYEQSDGYSPAYEMHVADSPTDPEGKDFDLKREPIKFLVLAHKRLCRK